jgi:RimJ/RimL family protein N-acetyltransferase
MPQQTPSPFSSLNLSYRAIRPADTPLFAALAADTHGYINSSVANISLPTASDASAFMRECTEKMLLGVVIWAAHPPSLTPLDIAALVGDAKVNGKGQLVETYGVAVGEIHLTRLPPDRAHHRSTEIGLCVLPNWQGRGYGGEAVAWALGYAFRMAGLHRVRIRAFEWNVGAVRLYERLGFKHEGREREAFWHEGRWWDEVGLGMLEGEWRALQEAQEKEE